jgi:hypothetical protein
MALALPSSLAIILQYDIHWMTGCKLSIHLRSDPLAVFDAISKNTPVKDYRLLIDIAQLRQSGNAGKSRNLPFLKANGTLQTLLPSEIAQTLLWARSAPARTMEQSLVSLRSVKDTREDWLQIRPTLTSFVLWYFYLIIYLDSPCKYIENIAQTLNFESVCLSARRKSCGTEKARYIT